MFYVKIEPEQIQNEHQSTPQLYIIQVTDVKHLCTHYKLHQPNKNKKKTKR